MRHGGRGHTGIGIGTRSMGLMCARTRSRRVDAAPVVMGLEQRVIGVVRLEVDIPVSTIGSIGVDSANPMGWV